MQAISEHSEKIKLSSGEVILWDICPSSQPWLLLENFESLKQPVIQGVKTWSENFLFPNNITHSCKFKINPGLTSNSFQQNLIQ